MKLTGIEIREKMVQIVSEFRKIELQNKGQGYAELEKIKGDLPNDIYETMKHCLDNPEKEFICNVDYAIKNK